MMNGIGGSIAFNLPDYEALSPTQKNEIEDLLYDNCGVDIVRLRTGNSDTLNSELATRARRNGAKTLLTSWSPPASLKSNNSIVGGTLRRVGGGTTGEYDYAAFAQWWYDRLNASRWSHDYISIQNEPTYEEDGKETCRFAATESSTSASYAKALEAVYDKIKNEPKIPKIVAVDAENHPAFGAIAPTVSSLSYVDHMGFHNYGTLNFPSVKSRYSGNRGWMTEWGADPEINDDWLVLAVNIHRTLVEGDASAYLAWRMVHGNNTGQVWAMIGVENRQYAVQNAFYAVKHYAKFIDNGSQRFSVTGAPANVFASGFLTPDQRKLVVIVINNGTADTNITFAGYRSFRRLQSYVTRTFDIGSNPWKLTARLNPAGSLFLNKKSITTYVFSR
jgi:glucuronoarabinoxylan endo-1,4-beta-xylanase